MQVPRFTFGLIS
jgi:hypothetical protein